MLAPDQHGVYDNGWEVGDSVPTPTIFAVLREQRPESTIAVFHEWGGFGRLVEKGIPDIIESPGDEVATINAAINFLLDGQYPLPQLMFIHIDHVDGAGHTRGWGSKGYYDAVNKVDGLIGNFIDAVNKKSILNESAFFISSDHGGRCKLKKKKRILKEKERERETEDDCLV